MKLLISPAKIVRSLIAVMAVLTVFSITVLLIRNYTGHGRLYGFGDLFNAGVESNLPTWYSSMTILFCSLLLWIIASAEKLSRRRYARYWKGLSIIFLYMSIDEACALHERAGSMLETLMKDSFLVKLGWVIPFAMLAAVIVIIYIPFLRSLPSSTRTGMIIAGGVYLAGAAGLEALGGLWRTVHGNINLVYLIESSLEEIFEMTGIIIFIYTFASYIASYVDDLSISFGYTEPVRDDVNVSYRVPEKNIAPGNIQVDSER